MNKKNRQALLDDFVGIPGLEPGKAGPESAVLPLHHIPIALKHPCFLFAMQSYEVFASRANFFETFFKKTSLLSFTPYIIYSLTELIWRYLLVLGCWI